MIGETIILFFQWYLLDAPRAIIQAIINFLKFGNHFFSIDFLIKTFFSHWHRYFWNYPSSFDIFKILEVFFSNMLSRIIGMILRTFLILVGLLFEFVILLLGILIFIMWFLLPILIFLMLNLSISFIY